MLEYEKPNVKWSDVAGLNEAIQALKEAFISPTETPHLFTGNRKTCKGFLLFGPPGAGKTFLAKAVRRAYCYTFISVYSSILAYNDRIDERQVTKIFRKARKDNPSIIFIDDIDSFCNVHSDTETDSVKIVQEELLLQMQGVATDNEEIFVLGTTNKPWMLDDVILKRFEKKMYIPLPDEEARLAIFKLSIGNTPICLSEDDLNTLAKRSDGLSGADISRLVQNALMQPVLKVRIATHFKKVRGPCPDDPCKIVEDLLTPCSPEEPRAMRMPWVAVPKSKLMEPEVTMDDVRGSLTHLNSKAKNYDLMKLENFMKDSGMMI